MCPGRVRWRLARRTLEDMSMFRLRTPDRTIDLGEFDNAQEALESAADRQREDRPSDGVLEVEVGGEWHPVDTEGDIS